MTAARRGPAAARCRPTRSARIAGAARRAARHCQRASAAAALERRADAAGVLRTWSRRSRTGATAGRASVRLGRLPGGTFPGQWVLSIRSPSSADRATHARWPPRDPARFRARVDLPEAGLLRAAPSAGASRTSAACEAWRRPSRGRPWPPARAGSGRPRLAAGGRDAASGALGPKEGAGPVRRPEGARESRGTGCPS